MQHTKKSSKGARTYRRPRPDGLPQQCYDLQGNKSASLFTGRVYVPVLVLTVTTRTSLSLPACVLMTFAIGHRVGTIPFSRRTTMSPTTMFLEGRRHLWKFCRLTRYSEDHRCQKCLTRDWHRSHRRRSEREQNEMAGSGRASRGLPIKKCPGVRASTPSSSQGKATAVCY